MSATDNNAIKTAIQQLAGTFNKDLVSIISCTVDKQNNDYTIDCTPISGDATTSIPSVKLNADNNDGFVIMPKVGSTVLVATSTRNNYYVFMYSDIDKVINIIDNNNSYEFSSAGFIWNDGTKGGLTNINDLKSALNLLQSNILTLQAATFAAISVYSAILDSGASAAAFNAVPYPLINLATIEDTKIKH